jgi:outer membrane protein
MAAAVTVSVLDLEAASAQQQSPDSVVVGVVDVDRVMQESKAGKSIKAQVAQQKNAFQAEVDRQQKLFDDAKAKLLAQRGTLKDDEFKKKADDLNKQGDQIQNNLAQRQRQLEQSLAKVRDQVEQAMELVTQDVAKAHGMTLVVNRAVVLVYNTNYDVTKEVIQKLDAKLPSVKLQTSSGAQGGGATSGAASGSSTGTQSSPQGSTAPNLQGLGGSSGDSQ